MRTGTDFESRKNPQRKRGSEVSCSLAVLDTMIFAVVSQLKVSSCDPRVDANLLPRRDSVPLMSLDIEFLKAILHIVASPLEKV